MSKKGKKRAALRATAAEIERQKIIEAGKRLAAKNSKSKKKIIIISSVISLVLVGLILGIVFSLIPKDKFSYTKSDLSDYIEISAADYKNYTVNIKKPVASESDVNRKIMRLLYMNRGDVLHNGATVHLEPIEVGDDVNIYYRGYYIDEDGREIDFDDNTLYNTVELGIGSLEFAEGFEESLIGVVPWEHNFNPETDRFTTGYVEDGDVIYISYSAIYPDGTSAKRENERIDLSQGDIDAVYGAGFSAFIKGTEANKTSIASLLEPHIFDFGAEGEVIYSDMIINSAIRYKNPPLHVNATFPLDYDTEWLRGKDVKFDVYFNGMICYTARTYDQAFITEVLKLKQEELEEYEGDTLLEKHRSMLYAEAERDSETLRESLISETVWKHLNGKVRVKKLPRTELNTVYEQIYGTLISEYNTYYRLIYPTIDDYARAKYNLTKYDSITDAMMREAKNTVTEKLIFYYIAREEGLLPTGKTFDSAYTELVAEYLAHSLETSYKDELDKITDEGEKNKKIEEIKNQMLEYYGKEYFAELVYYEAALPKIIAYANIIEE